MKGRAVKDSIPIGPSSCIWSNHWCGTWVLRRNNFIMFNNRNWRCRHYKIEIRITFTTRITHTHTYTDEIQNCVDRLPAFELYSTSATATFTFEELISSLLCIFSSSSWSSCCRILIFASITRCSSWIIENAHELDSWWKHFWIHS